MYSLFVTLLTSVLVFGASYWYVQTASICPVPITYKVGDVDERFNISTDEIKNILANSSEMWESALGRELFVYDDNSSFLVNFIYDERQQLASTEEEWRISLDKKEAEGKGMITKVKEMNEGYTELQKKYSASLKVYETRLSVYNDQVEKFNEQGGAPKDEFAELQSEQKYLSDLTNKLVKSENELNKLVSDMNTIGEEGKRMIDEYNKEVLEYNKTFGEVDPFTQGDFRRDRINVYKFSDSDELTRVIAHEFGHSLGIGHVEGEDSIMYYLAKEQSSSLYLSVQDIEEFGKVCGDGGDFSHEVRRVIRTALSYFN
jgi:predicted Zn-dependent protease